MNSRPLRYALYAGVAYFVAMAIAHFLGIKWPLLFVYYDTPYYAYQDRIISFAVIAYATLFFAAANRRDLVPHALFVLGLTALGLTSVNLSDDLASVLEEGRSTAPYWWQTAGLTAYWLTLAGLWMKDRRGPEV